MSRQWRISQTKTSTYRCSRRCPRSLRDKMMNTRNIENKLALLAALIVLIGVSAAAGSALAAETVNDTDVGVTDRATTDETINGAREAVAETAAEAAEALKVENTFDLDNHLSDITFTLLAANK